MDIPDSAALVTAFRNALATATTATDIDTVVRKHTGKKSSLKAALKGLRAVPQGQRPAVAAALNEARQTMESEGRQAREDAVTKA
ncbi:MAG: hypothetical protein AB8H79_08670, partial [Myxococcota bacterium]